VLTVPRKTNFTVNGSNYYRVTATIGKKPDGSPIRKQFYGESKKAAEQKRDEYMAGLRQGLSIDYQKNTFGASFKHWLERVHRHSIGVSTYDKYTRFHRLYIAECGFAGMRLIDVKAANVQGWYNSLLETTTPKNIHQINKLFAVFFKYCLKADILIRNPLLAVELPKIPKELEKNTALSDYDIEKLVAACKEDLRHFPFLFACFTGLRAGELLALTYKDIDFRDNMINVNKSVKYLTVEGDYKPLLSEAKTESSVRRVPILTEIRPMLQEHISQARQRNRIFSFNGDFLLFPSATGTYRETNNFRQAYQRLCDKLGIEEGRTIHSLRHTFCTILARQGVSLLDASRLMGHSNVNITAKVYSHINDTDKKNAVQKLAAYFN
jgi:integrase